MAEGVVTPNTGLPQHFQPAPPSTGQWELGLLPRHMLTHFTHRHVECLWTHSL